MFLHFSRCAKAGFLFTNKVDSIDNDYEGKKSLTSEFKEIAFNLISKYEQQPGIKISKNQQFETSKGETAIADVIIKSQNKNALIALVCTTRVPNWLQIQNLAYTYYVSNKAGVKFDKSYIGFVREEYSFNGKLTYELLRIKDYTKKVTQLQFRVESLIKQSKEKLRNNALPANKIDYYCVKPGTCPFKKHCCEKEFPSERSIQEINDLSFYRKLQLYRNGIVDYKDLPPNLIISDKSKKQIIFTQSNKIIKEKKELRDWIDKVSQRKFIWFLDMETDSPIIPLRNSKKPFSKYPFIYTLLYSDLASNRTGSFQKMTPTNLSTLTAKEFLKNFIAHIKLNNDAPIIVSNMNKMKECFNNLSAVSPEFSQEIGKIIKRLVDIRFIFTEHFYYDPKFKGSSYLKEIVPVMCPEITYTGLTINSGIQAQYEFRKLVNEKSATAKANRIKHLENYAHMDALSIYKTFEFLKKEVNK